MPDGDLLELDFPLLECPELVHLGEHRRDELVGHDLLLARPVPGDADLPLERASENEDPAVTPFAHTARWEASSLGDLVLRQAASTSLWWLFHTLPTPHVILPSGWTNGDSSTSWVTLASPPTIQAGDVSNQESLSVTVEKDGEGTAGSHASPQFSKRGFRRRDVRCSVL